MPSDACGRQASSDCSVGGTATAKGNTLVRSVNRAKRIVVAVLVLAIAAMLALAIWRHTLDLRSGYLLVLGIILGALYAISPRSYDTILAAIKRLRSRIGPLSFGVDAKLTDDDDPRNLNPKVYLPILLGAIVVAAVIAFVYLHR